MSNSYIPQVGATSKKYRSIMNDINVSKVNARVLPVGATGRNYRSPAQFTGCASELSYHSDDDQKYSEALKNYTAIYRQYHAYLEFDDPVSVHDYTLNITETEEHGVLGLLGDEIEQLMRSHVHFSDDEIEQLGYLGWLQH